MSSISVALHSFSRIFTTIEKITMRWILDSATLHTTEVIPFYRDLGENEVVHVIHPFTVYSKNTRKAFNSKLAPFTLLVS